ncbi:MAG: hypothetical protein N2235_05135 [Fischerella sp.]|nr:hypothetical protein [Fischerella sp.]
MSQNNIDKDPYRKNRELRDLLENQIRSDPVIMEKLKNDVYAQNFYAAFCNMQWCRTEIFELLKREPVLSYSWRGAGGLVANLRNKNEIYMDYYCSGMNPYNEERDNRGPKGYVTEGTVTDEIREDLLRLGWVPIPYDDSEEDFA